MRTFNFARLVSSLIKPFGDPCSRWHRILCVCCLLCRVSPHTSGRLGVVSIFRRCILQSSWLAEPPRCHAALARVSPETSSDEACERELRSAVGGRGVRVVTRANHRVTHRTSSRCSGRRSEFVVGGTLASSESRSESIRVQWSVHASPASVGVNPHHRNCTFAPVASDWSGWPGHALLTVSQTSHQRGL